MYSLIIKYVYYVNINQSIIIIIMFIIFSGIQNKQVTPNHLQRLTPKAVGHTKITVRLILFKYN